jgi:hypothetical protein
MINMWVLMVCICFAGPLCEPIWITTNKVDSFICAQFPYLSERGIPSIEPVNQDVFEGAMFFEIDTFKVTVMPQPPEKKPLRVAIDNDGCFYRIMGFDKCEFNDLIKNTQLTLSNENKYVYGRFFLKMCHLGEASEPVFVNNIDCFLKLNRAILLDSSTYLPSLHGNWDSVKSQIENTLYGLPFNQCSINSVSGSVLCTYVIWFFSTGDLHRIDVSIDSFNRCSIISDKTIGTNIGYWNSLKM